MEVIKPFSFKIVFGVQVGRFYTITIQLSNLFGFYLLFFLNYLSKIQNIFKFVFFLL